MPDKSAEQLRRMIAAYEKAARDIREARQMVADSTDEGSKYAMYAGGRAALDVLNAGLQGALAWVAPGAGKAIDAGKKVLEIGKAIEKVRHGDSTLGKASGAVGGAGELVPGTSGELIKTFAHVTEIADAMKKGDSVGMIAALKSAQGDVIKLAASVAHDENGKLIGEKFGAVGTSIGSVKDGIEG